MKLNELRPLPNRDYFNNLEYNNPEDTDRNQFISGEVSLTKAMKSHGFTKMGSGMHASVFVRDDYPWILKVFSLEDKAYQAWIEFSKARPNNPFVPRFKGNIKKFNDSVAVIRVEKLQPITYRTKNYRHLEAVMWSFPTTEDWAVFKDHRDDLKEIIQFMKSYSNDVDTPNVMQRDNGQLVLIDPVA